MRGIAVDQARRLDQRYRRRDPELRRGRALLGGARFLRPRPRPASSTISPNILHYVRAGVQRGAEARHDVHRRADDQSRPAAGEGAVRRLDRRDPRPLAVGAVRAHDRRDRDRRARFSPSRPRAWTSPTLPPHERAADDIAPLSTATGTACARAFPKWAAMALPDYELLELVLFRSIPRRDVKPLAKELMRRFGSFAEVLAAPPARLHGGGRHGRERHRRPQDRRGLGPPPRQGRGAKAAGPVLLEFRPRLLPHRHGVHGQGAVPAPLSRQAQCAHRRRGAAIRHRRSHAGLSARDRQTGARTLGLRVDPGPQSSLAATRRPPPPTSR